MSFVEEIPDQENERTSLPKDSEKENPDTGSAGVAVTRNLPIKILKKSNHRMTVPTGLIEKQKITPIRTMQIRVMKQTVA